MKYKVKNIKLAPKGQNQMALAAMEMPVVADLAKKFTKTKPFLGLKISACLHITKETGNLLIALKAGGALVSVCGSNPLSTQDSVAAALAKAGIKVFAQKNQSEKQYYQNLNRALDINPYITIDDGADLITTIHTKRKKLLQYVRAGLEETTTGVIRLKAMAKASALKYPVVAINDTPTKHLFDNEYGTGQSTLDAIMRATNILFATKTVVVAGYGHCGWGIAFRAKGLGARVVVTEINEVRALKAIMDGFQVMEMRQASKIGDIFITATGNKNVIRAEHIKTMKDKVIMANAGHFNVEISLPELKKLAKKQNPVNSNVTEYVLLNNKKIYLLSEGRLVNLAAGEGHPSSVMDMSFANQALTCQWLMKNYKSLSAEVHDVPAHIDEQVAKLKLASLQIQIDKLTPEQQKYLTSWQEGT